MRLGIWLWFAVAGGLVLYKSAACTLPHGCTEIGCSDNVSIAAAFSDRTWPVGAYRLALQFDEQMRVCSFSMPADLPARGAVSSVSCEPRDAQLSVSISPVSSCTETRTEEAATESCKLIDGQHTLHIDAGGTPGRMQLRLDRDGVLVSQHDLTLRYTASRPNGPDCEPLCRQSSLELRLD